LTEILFIFKFALTLPENEENKYLLLYLIIMKKSTILFFLIFTIAKINAQDYYISFAGTGTGTPVDSVKVKNITQGTNLTMPGTDTLHLTGTQGIYYENFNNESMSACPNPMLWHTELSFYAEHDGYAQLTIYDMSGKVVLQIRDKYLQGIQRYRVTGLKQGIYFIVIHSESYCHTLKLISLSPDQNEVEIEYLGSEKSESYVHKSKNLKSVVSMAYTAGDSLQYTGYSCTYTALVTDIPSNSKTIEFIFADSIANCGTVSDVEGNIYNTVQIGTQCWMRENLRTNKYRNNTSITNVTDATAWASLTTEAYCHYNNNIANVSVYGELYNWYAVVDSNNICPAGWHIPTDAEFTTLSTFLGGESVAGGKLKANCSGLWQTPNTGATNETGYTALPAGHCHYTGYFSFIGYHAFWWSSTDADHTSAYYRDLSTYDNHVTRGVNDKTTGFSVRCLKD